MRAVPDGRVDPTLLLLLTTWWVSNNVYAVDAGNFFALFPASYLFIDLTLTQLLFGLVLTRLYHTLYPPHPSPTAPPPSPTQRKVQLPISVLHYLATLLSNISYSTLGATTTLLWKLSEPASTTILNRVLLNQSTSLISLLGVGLTLLGVFRFSFTTFSVPSFTPIILANLFFPLRNVLIKLSQLDDASPATQISKRHASADAGLPRFERMLLFATPPALGVLVVKVVLFGTDASAVPYMLRNACLFTVYQLASFLLLERLDALTHSLLNTLKRFTGIVLSMVVVATPLTVPHVQGLFATVLGFVLYLFGRERRKFGNVAIVGAVMTGVVIMGIGAGVVNFIDGGVARVALDGGDVVREAIDPEYLVTLVNQYRKRRRSITYNSYEEVVSDTGGNVGNLVWQYGAHVALPDFSGAVICDSDRREDCALVAQERGLKHVVYNPMANTLNPDKASVFRGLAKSIRNDRADTLLVGVGVQMEFRKGSDDPEFNSSARITVTSEDYLHPNNTKIFLRDMENSGGYMLTRGEFTVNVARRAGFTRAYSIGCPSFWINEDVRLGRSLEQKYKAIAARQGDKSLKIAVNVKNIRGYHRQIAHIRDTYPNSRFYAQSIGDMAMLKNLNVPFERARYFTNVEDWIADLKEMDVGYGVRIHGNMIALGAGLPTFVVASDWRVLEMARAMKIPYTTTYDPVFEKDLDLAKMIGNMPRFDGEEFDRNRCQIAKIYIKLFSRYGIRVRRHVIDASNIC